VDNKGFAGTFEGGVTEKMRTEMEIFDLGYGG
jgi:hypothetical protein